ncbi:hypothetical protein V8F33_006649 [Rhypophila sp. PSN 637]
MAKYEGNSTTGVAGSSDVDVNELRRKIDWRTRDEDMERYLNYNPEIEDHNLTMDLAIWCMDWDITTWHDHSHIKDVIGDLKEMVEYLQGLDEPAKRVQEHIQEHIGLVNAWRRKAEGVLQYLEDKFRPKQNKRKADQIEESEGDADSGELDWDDLDSDDLDWNSIYDEDRSNIIVALGEAYRPKFRNEKVMKAVRERIDIWNGMTREVWLDRDSWVQMSNLASHRLNKKVLQKLCEMEFDARERLGFFAVGNEEEMPQFMISDYEAVWARTQDTEDSE